ncbi:MAG: GHKL domain-containing protein [Candidatus Omnitrophica bacterium]|nr:GHKL domain-containing protein [Candidatus Omnitrophota bacterium]
MNWKRHKPNSFPEPPPWETGVEKKQLELFADVASHDLREPLEKIIFFGDFIKQRYGAGMDEKGRDYLERMIGSAMRMSRLIEDILEFSRLTSRTFEMKPVDLMGIVREVISDLEVRIQESNALIEVGKLPAITADSKQIYHLFLNLISNAIKFRKKEESPRIIVRSLEEEEAGHVTIVVEDNGIGFEQQFADQIFKPFERLHSQSDYEGSGLGLSICQRIVMAHGGCINARGVAGKGSMFIITLPKVEKEAGRGEKSFDC